MTRFDPTIHAPMAPAHDAVVFSWPPAAGRADVTAGPRACHDDRDRGRFEHAIHALARGARIIGNGGTHGMGGDSPCRFHIVGDGGEAGFDSATRIEGPKGDTVTGPVARIGNGVTTMPGATPGTGAIVAPMPVVAKDVPPCAVEANTPARVVPTRFDADIVARRPGIGGWHWSADRTTRDPGAIRGADPARLEAAT